MRKKEISLNVNWDTHSNSQGNTITGLIRRRYLTLSNTKEELGILIYLFIFVL